MPALLLSRLRLTPQTFRVVASYYVTFISLGFVSTFLGPALPFLAAKVQVDLATASNMLAVKAMGFMAGSFIAGRAMDRLRPHGVIQGGLILTALATMAVPVASRFWVLVAVMFLAGIFVGTVDVGGNILIVWAVKKRVAPFLTGLHFIWGVGALATPLIIVYLHQLTGGLLAPFLVLGGLIMACALLYVRLPSPQPAQTGRQSRSRLARMPLVTLAVLLFLAGTIEVSIALWIFTYVLNLQMGSEQVAGWINSSFFAAISASRLASAFILARVSSQVVIAAALALVVAACLGVLLFPASLAVLWIGVVGCGLGVAVLFPLTLSTAPLYLPAEGRVTSWMFGGASLGFITIPWLIGRFFETAGPFVIWHFTAIGALLGAVCLIVLHYTPRIDGSRAQWKGFFPVRRVRKAMGVQPQ